MLPILPSLLIPISLFVLIAPDPEPPPQPPDDPIPGGGVCPTCITDTTVGQDPETQSTTIKVCIRLGSKFVGSDLSSIDDLPLADLLTDKKLSTWRAEIKTLIEGKNKQKSYEWRPYCTSDCSAKEVTIQPPAGAQGKALELTSSTPQTFNAPSGLRIVFTSIGAQKFPDYRRYQPTVEAPEQPPEQELPFDNNFTCDPTTATTTPKDSNNTNSGMSMTDVIKQVDPSDNLAFIAHPSIYGGFRMCSGVRITEDLILTAAHCFEEAIAPASLTVIVGRRNPITDLASKLAVEYVIKHPDFDAKTLVNDLAIVRLKKPLGPVKFRLDKVDGLTCTTHVFGFGVRPDPMAWSKYPYYDIGVRHDEYIQDHTGKTCHPRQTQPQGIECVDKREFIPLDAAGPQLCHGDSGGAVFKDCGAAGVFLAGISTARVITGTHELPFKIKEKPKPAPVEPPLVRQVPSEVANQYMSASTLTAPLAFSQGNACGKTGQLAGFIATRLDEKDRAWIACVRDKKLACVKSALGEMSK